MTQRYNALAFALVVALSTILMAGGTAEAQYFYLDVNGDGLSFGREVGLGNSVPFDCLGEATSSVDVYFVTDQNPDGTAASCASSEALTINWYEFILRSSGQGTVIVNAWTDNLGFDIPLLVHGDGKLAAEDKDVAVALGGPQLPPGKYKLGSLAVTISGNPILSFVTSSQIFPATETAFGSACVGTYVQGLALGADIPISSAFGLDTCQPTDVLPTTWGKIKQRYK